MKVLLTGSTGFVGQSVLKDLLAKGYNVHAVVRKPGSASALLGSSQQLREFEGDIRNPSQIERAATDCETAIHLVGIIEEKPKRGITFETIHVEGTRGVIEGCRQAGVRRFIHMSALGTRPKAVAAYHQTKHKAECLVRESGLDFTIFRPSLILGPTGKFTRQVEQWARGKALPFLFMPYFAKGPTGIGGSELIQPVRVTDVATAFVDSITASQTSGKTYDLVGPTRFTWPAFYRAFARQLMPPPHFARPPIPIPGWYARLLLKALPAKLLPFNQSQLQMALEPNTGDTLPLEKDMGFVPRAVFPLSE